MRFKEWFYQEAMTSTSCVATFARPSIPMRHRDWMPSFGEEEGRKKKKKASPPYEQPQVKESR